MTDLMNVTLNRHFNEPLLVESNDLAAKGEASFRMNDKDWKFAIIVRNGSTAGAFTIKAGNGVNACNDLTFDMEASKNYTITIESDLYKKMDADNLDIVTVSSTVACKVEVIKLP